MVADFLKFPALWPERFEPIWQQWQLLMIQQDAWFAWTSIFSIKQILSHAEF
jgi:hypothetical protein